MIGALATWLIAGFIVVGLGLPVGVRMATRGPTALRVSLLAGLFSTFIIVVALGFVVALRSPAVVGTLLVLAGVGSLTSIRRLRRLHWRSPGAGQIWVVIPAIALLIGMLTWALTSANAPTNYDSGLYHLGAIEYAAQAPTVFGLANLFAPLGYANTLTPIAAVFTNGFLDNSGFVLVNAFLLFLLPLDLIFRARERALPSVGLRVLMIGLFTIYPPMLFMADAWVLSPTSDTAVFVLTMLGVASFADIAWRGRVRRSDAILVMFPLALAGTMRPQAWLMLLLVLVVIIGVARRSSTAAVPVMATLLIPPLIAVSATLARDVVLSGWLFYPLNIAPLPVSWRAEDPAGLVALTLGNARDPGPSYQQAAEGYAWLIPWAARLPNTWEFPILIVMGIGAVLLMVLGRRRGPIRLRALALTVFPGAVASVMWLFLTPPTFRFGWAPLFSTAAILLGWGWMFNRWADRWFMIAGIASVVVTATLTITVRMPQWPLDIPQPDVQSVVLSDGTAINLPVPTDQCWLTFPLCTPTPVQDLELRGNHWSDGFTRGPDPGETGQSSGS